MAYPRLLLVLSTLVCVAGCFGGAKKSPEPDPRLATRATIGVLTFQDRGTRVAEQAEPWVEVEARSALRDAGYDSRGLSGVAGAEEAIHAFRSAGVGMANMMPVASSREKLAATVRSIAGAGSVDAVLFVRDIPQGPIRTFEIGVIDAAGDILLGGSATESQSGTPKPSDTLRKALGKLPPRGSAQGPTP